MYIIDQRERKRRFLKMIYRHWKKAALALTALFWASCEESTTSPTVVSQEQGNSSSSIEPLTAGSSETATSSSSTETESSSTGMSSSSSETGISSANKSESSSSSSFIPNSSPSSSSANPSATPCYEDVAQRTVNEQTSTTKSVFKCDDGATCIESVRETWEGLPCHTEETEEGLVSMCPDYGVFAITEKSYLCDGKTYTEAEFKTRYFKDTKKISCEVFNTDVICDNGESFVIDEENGVKTYRGTQADYTEEEFNNKYEATEPLPAPLYGVFFKNDL